MYNLRVAEDHTYFVECDEWGFSLWAHNMGADGCGVRSLAKEELTRKLAKGEVVTDPAEIQALLGSGGLKARGTHNPNDVLGGLFQHHKKNGGAGFISVTRDPETHVLTLVKNSKTKGANATIAKIDLSKIPADRVFDLADPALFSQMTTRFGKKNYFTTIRDEGAVAIRGEIPAEAITKIVGAGPHNRARNTAPAQQAIEALLGK